MAAEEVAHRDFLRLPFQVELTRSVPLFIGLHMVCNKIRDLTSEPWLSPCSPEPVASLPSA